MSNTNTEIYCPLSFNNDHPDSPGVCPASCFSQLSAEAQGIVTNFTSKIDEGNTIVFATKNLILDPERAALADNMLRTVVAQIEQAIIPRANANPSIQEHCHHRTKGVFAWLTRPFKSR